MEKKKKNMTMEEVWKEAVKRALPFFVPKKIKEGLLAALLLLLCD